jgi:nucleotide-binding universal stress UspA family protein
MDNYKTILVGLDRGHRNPERLEIAARLAGGFGARLVALFALSADPVSTYSDVRELMEQAATRWHDEASAEAERVFARVVPKGVDARFRRTREDALAAMRADGRLADLIILGQQDRKRDDDSGLQASFTDEMVLSAGRPVLCIPSAGEFATIGERVLVAWDGSREAARAVTDALPFLTRARKVDIAIFNPEKLPLAGESEPGAALVEYLACHGVSAHLAIQRKAGEAIGERLLSLAYDLSADLLVMGAYGHSRTRELILGGVTRTIRESMTLPVLLAH